MKTVQFDDSIFFCWILAQSYMIPFSSSIAVMLPLLDSFE
jgi:hypothetical protein